MNKHAHNALQAAHSLVAFIAAGIETARDYRATLEDQLDDSRGKQREMVKRWLSEVRMWLAQADSLMAMALDHSREVSREVARIERGLSDRTDEIRLLAQRLEEAKGQVVEDFLNHTSRQQLQQAEMRQESHLSHDTSEEQQEDPIAELEDDLDEFEALLESEADPKNEQETLME